MSAAPPPSGDPPKYEQGGYYPPPAGQPPPVAYPAQPGYAPQHPGYPPQQPGYPPQHGYVAGNTTVVLAQPTMAMGPRDGSQIRYTQSPALIVCQHCRATVTTSMDYETGLLTWAIAGGLCIVGCFAGCCLIPFCIDGTKDIEHKCPNCHNTVGRFRHFS